MSGITIYDVTIDAMRPATQQDLDDALRAAQAMAQFRRGIRSLEGLTHRAIRGEVQVAALAEAVDYLASAPTVHAKTQLLTEEGIAAAVAVRIMRDNPSFGRRPARRRAAA